MKTIDKYVYKALDYYPFNLEETVESLDYALAYDENNVTALTLYGRLLAEQLQDYEAAKIYFEKALATNINAIEVYSPFIETLIKNEDFDQAQSLIDFALTVKGANKMDLLFKVLLLQEMKGEIKTALKTLKVIASKMYNNDYQYLIEETTKRLKNKLEVEKNKNNKRSKKKRK
jgi:tetratricopeptide (TPR) repeat protein